MAKQQKNKPQPDVNREPAAAQPAPAPLPKKERKPISINDFSVQAVIVALLAFVFYINSVSNEYAHDDGIVIVKNEYVQEGFAGIDSIFRKDAYDSYYKQLNTSNQLSGGRYRPLSIATFAIEQQFFGAIPVEKIDSYLHYNLSYGIRGPAEKKLVHDMHIRHFFNVLWYMLCVVMLLYFLRYIIFRNAPMVAFIAAILFTIHPVHTEVVANVKSRDEIMSLIFMCLTFILAFKFEELRSLKNLAASNNKKEAKEIKPGLMILTLLGALMCYFLAFLSKEYAITMLVMLPFSFYLFNDYSVASSIKATLPYLIVLGIYGYIRIRVAMPDSDSMDGDKSVLDALFNKPGNGSSDREILNNPYYLATHTQKIATEIASSIYYLRLLIWPQPLSADYSYNSIPYKDFSNWQVWLSLIVHLAMVGCAMFWAFVKKSYKIFAFAFAFYFVHLLLVNNLIFNIGATLGERLIFHSSVGFCIVVAVLLCKGVEKLGTISVSRPALIGIMSVVIVLCGIKTISRNLDWKNDATLFMQDIKTVPNSVLVNGNVAASLITMADFEKDPAKHDAYLHDAVSMLHKAITIHGYPSFVAGFLNQGIAYYKLGLIDSAQICLDSVRKNYPNYPTLANLYSLLADHYVKKGWNDYGKVGKYPEAIAEFKKGITVDSTNADLWYNLGGAYFSNHQYPEAIQAWQRTLQIKPDYIQARQGLQAAMAMAGGAVLQQPQKRKK